SATGSVRGGGSSPNVATRIVSPAGVHITGAIKSTPDDHFTARPDGRLRKSGIGRIGGTRGRPTIRAGIVSCAGVQINATGRRSAPDDHIAASPHRRLGVSGGGRVGGAGGCPTIRAGVVSPTGVEKGRVVSAAPDDH